MTVNVDLQALPEAWRPVVKAPLAARVAWLDTPKNPVSAARVTALDSGGTFPYFVRIEYTVGEAPGWHRYDTVISGGVEVVERGAAAASKTLRAAGFPKTPVASPQLLTRLLNHFELFGERPIWGAFEQAPRDGVVVAMVDPSTLQIDYPQQPKGGGGGGITAPETHRLRVAFDAEANLTMTEAVRPSGGVWGPTQDVTPPRSASR